jgi:YegS/Rv2252/BmrU family lipid kinase
VPEAIVLVNPRARAGERPPIGRILRAFRAADWSAEVWAGEGVGWAEAAARRAVDFGAAAIFGAGGDGLLADILPAVLGTHVALGVVPLGTGNVWARELGLPLEPDRAIATQLAQPARRVDVGLANGRPFLVIASVGFDAQIVRLVESQTKALGQIAYPLAGVSLAGAVRGVRARVTIDDEAPLELSLLAGMATNGRLYGGLVPLSPDARVDDGLLDVVLFAGSGPVEAAAHAAKVLTGLHLSDANITVRRVRQLRIEASDGVLPVQTDGDPRGTTPLSVEVQPGALLALGVPQAS